MCKRPQTLGYIHIISLTYRVTGVTRAREGERVADANGIAQPLCTREGVGESIHRRTPQQRLRHQVPQVRAICNANGVRI
jgi:hypothetical protein